MKKKIQSGYKIHIQTAPFPFAQFVDIYTPDERLITIQDQNSCSRHELTEWAKEAIARDIKYREGA